MENIWLKQSQLLNQVTIRPTKSSEFITFIEIIWLDIHIAFLQCHWCTCTYLSYFWWPFITGIVIVISADILQVMVKYKDLAR